MNDNNLVLRAEQFDTGIWPLTRARGKLVQTLMSKGVRDVRVLQAFARVPRHFFVLEAYAFDAYADVALPILQQQTISQPYVIARMLERLLSNREGLGKTLEIGSGCGYQSALLAQLSTEVYGLERIKALHQVSRENVRPLRIPNLRLKYGDGFNGLPDCAPFDTVILAAGSESVPEALKKQLADGGRLIMPFGKGEQRILLIERRAYRYNEQLLEAVRFVPMLPGLK